jgi:hypothetical protein
MKYYFYVKEGKQIEGWAPVSHTCNPSYSGGIDQEDLSSRPAQVNSSKRPYLKNTHHKKELVEWLTV